MNLDVTVRFLADPEAGAMLHFELATVGARLIADGQLGPGPWPVVVFVAGSGPTNRDGNSPYHSGRNDGPELLAGALAGRGGGDSAIR